MRFAGAIGRYYKLSGPRRLPVVFFTQLFEASRITRTSAAATLPPTFQLITGLGNLVGDEWHVQTSLSPTFNTLIINDFVLLAESGMTTAMNIKLAGLSVATYVRFFMKRGNAIGTYSDVFWVGTAAAPTMSNASSFNNVETRPLLGTITSPLPVYCYIEGQDMLAVELVPGPQPATSYTFRWLGDGVKSYDTPDDFDTNHIYDLDVALVGQNGIEARFPITIPLLDLDTVPDNFSMAPTTGVVRSTLTLGPIVPISGLDASYAAPYFAPIGADVRKRVAGAWEAWLPGAGMTTPVGTVVNTNDLQLRRTSDSGYSAAVITRLMVGVIFADWSLQTLDDPDAVSIVPYSGGAVYKSSSGASTSDFTQTFTAGRWLLVYGGRRASAAASVQDNGSGELRVSSASSDNAVQIYDIVITSTGDKTVTFTKDASEPFFERHFFLAIKLSSSEAGVAGTAIKPFGYYPTTTTTTGLTVTTGGKWVAALFEDYDQELAADVGTIIGSYVSGNKRLYITQGVTSASPSMTRVDPDGNPPCTMAALVFNKGTVA